MLGTNPFRLLALLWWNRQWLTNIAEVQELACSPSVKPIMCSSMTMAVVSGGVYPHVSPTQMSFARRPHLQASICHGGM
jgi:hypothetical protein